VHAASDGRGDCGPVDMLLRVAFTCLALQVHLQLVSAGCSMHVLEGKACTNEAKVKILGRPPANSSDKCCAACTAMATCGAWTFHSHGGGCLVANRASSPGQIEGATCGSKAPLPPPLPPAPPPPPLPPLPKPPAGLQVASLQLEYQLIMSDKTGFLRDPSSPIQAPDGVWHAWAVWVDPKYGQEGWSGKLKHFYSSTLASNWTNDGFAMRHSDDPLAFDHTGQNSPGAQYDAEAKLWYLFYTGATPEGTTGYPPVRGGSPMDNLSAQGVAVSASPFGPWKRLGVVAPGGLAWGPGGKGGGYRPNVWNGLRVDSGRALIVNGTRLYSTKGIGNGTAIPNSNPTGSYQALQGVFFPANQSSWAPPYSAFSGNPVTRAGPTGNSMTVGGSENCEFFSGPDGYFHATCAAHGALYPGGSCPHYLVSVLPGTQEHGQTQLPPNPSVNWQFVGFHCMGPPEATPVYSGGPPGDQGQAGHFIARNDGGISLYNVSWSPVLPSQ
jgi:hypothetical protein